MTTPASLIELRDIWNQRLVALGDDTEAIQSGMLIAQTILSRHAERLNDFNRAVALPTEVLQRVFLSVRAPKVGELTSGNRSTSPLSGFSRPSHGWTADMEWILVTHVCHRWREVAISYPNLWTDIDVGIYGIPFSKEMLERMGALKFTFSAEIKQHQELVSDLSFRERISDQLTGLTLDFDNSVTHPGASLDTLLSFVSCRSEPPLRQLSLTCHSSYEISWSVVMSVLSSLTSLHLEGVHMRGKLPTTIPMLTYLSLESVDFRAHESDSQALGILDLVRGLPRLEAISLKDCFFVPENASKASLPTSLESAQFNTSYWSIGECRTLALLLPQSEGERAFKIREPDAFGEQLSEDMLNAVHLGLRAHELVVEFKDWSTVNASIELKCDHPQTKTLRSYRLDFRNVAQSFWPEFCSFLANIDMRDASLRIVCGYDPADSSGDVLRELRRLTVSLIYVTGKWSPSITAKLFSVMREVNWESPDTIDGVKTALPFAALRDICIQHHPVAKVESTDDGWGYSYLPQPSLDSIIETAPHLLWYSRARRYRLFQPLRTVALPLDLLQKPWVTELEGLLEQKVVSYEAFIEAQDEVEKTGCRAMVLHRPVLGSSRAWNPLILTAFVPLIATLGILWTSSRRR